MSAPIIERPGAAPGDRKEQRAWYFYDWANSAFATTVAGVLFGPYLVAMAESEACNGADPCDTDGLQVALLGFDIAPGAIPPVVITISTVISALILPLLGAVADRTARKKDLLAAFAWTGSFAAVFLFFMDEDTWRLGLVAFLIANFCFAASAVFNDSILPLISSEAERDRVSSRGWALGYAGGGLLLAVNFAFLTFAESLGISEGLAVRISMLSAALWWALFTFIPWRGIKNRPPADIERVEGDVFARSFGQLWKTLKEMRNYPVALLFLVAYLFFNDGIQTVISQSSLFGVEELGFEISTMLAIFLIVQFVAVIGALLFGAAAERFGAKTTILVGLVFWGLIVTFGLVIPEEQLLVLVALGVAIGLVLGGTQALARSYFSLLIPAGKEAEFFSFYHAMDRGTSWFGSAVFAGVFILTDSYRPALFALIFFFVVGGLILMRVNTAQGIADAANGGRRGRQQANPT